APVSRCVSASTPTDIGPTTFLGRFRPCVHSSRQSTCILAPPARQRRRVKGSAPPLTPRRDFLQTHHQTLSTRPIPRYKCQMPSANCQMTNDNFQVTSDK